MELQKWQDYLSIPDFLVSNNAVEQKNGSAV